MVKLIFILFVSICPMFIFSQNPMGGGRGGGASMNIGHVYGKIIDAKTNKAFEAASVQIIQTKTDPTTKQSKDVVIGGQLTKSNGDFSIENLPIGPQLKVKITAIGYSTITQDLQFKMDMAAAKSGDMAAALNNIDKDLGNIKISILIQKGDVVTVVAQTPTLQLGVDRKIFNVDKNIVSAGGSGVDVLKNVPSVSVDIDGNLTLRNSTPQLFVDGRPTTLTLDQIPSDAIASVELITNPSAKFDASGGTSGIVNIVLKKNRKAGYNGNVRASIDSRARVGGGADINVRQNKINVFASVNYNQRKSLSWTNTDRLNYYNNPNVSIIQTNSNVAKGAFKFVRTGFDYFLDNRNTISIAANIMGGVFKPNEVIDIYQSTIGSYNSASKNYRDLESYNKFRNNGGTLSYKHLFTNAGNEITADITYNKSKNTNNSDYFNSPYSNDPVYQTSQKILANGGRENLTAQTDYAMPFKNNAKLEAGLRYSYNSSFSINNNYSKTYTSGDFVYLPNVGYNYESTEKVYAAYSTYSQKFNNTNVQAGLRWESSSFNGNLISKNQTFSNSYPNSLFPSLFITQSVGTNQFIQLNYTRKINRPNFFQLIPFIDYSDSLNITKGNPALVPEFTNSIEFGYQLPYAKKASLLLNIYYKSTSNLITRFQSIQTINSNDVVLNSFINATKSIVYGLELTSKNNITNYWDITTNLNFYGSKLTVPNLPVIQNNLSWFGKANSNFRLPKNLTLQISGEYQSKSILPPGGSSSNGGGGGGGRGMMGGGMGGGQSSSAQGHINQSWSMDLGFKKEFWKEKSGSISLSVNDIFRTKVSSIYSETSLFTQNIWKQRDPQVFRLSFNYRFGKMDMSLFKRKSTKATEGVDSGMGI